jgi:hypothetical protein
MISGQSAVGSVQQALRQRSLIKMANEKCHEIWKIWFSVLIISQLSFVV